MESQQVIGARGVEYAYSQQPVLAGVDFSAYKGQVFGLLGANGAGKTTLVRLLCGQLRPLKGEVRVLDLDPAQQGERLRQLIGVMPEQAGHYKRLSLVDNLLFFGRIFQVPKPKERALELLELVGLGAKAQRPVATLSKGMRQRLALARALLASPQLLFLDEPTAGLDPHAARQVRQLVADFCRQGGSVFLTTHYLEEAEELCARVAILEGGRIVCEGAPRALCQEYLPPSVQIWRGGELVEAAPGLEQLFCHFTKRPLGQE